MTGRRVLGVLLLILGAMLFLSEAQLLPFEIYSDRYYCFADSFTRYTAGTTNFGIDTGIWVGVMYNPGFGMMRGYFKHQLPSTLEGVITSANFYVYVGQEVGYQNLFELHQISDNWAEDTITWNSQPYFDSASVPFGIKNVTAGTWESWDVRDYAVSEQQGDRIISFLLKANEYGPPNVPGFNSAAIFRSREYAGYEPYLEIITSNDVPSAVISVPKTNYQINEVVPFSAGLSVDPDGWITSYSWKFGDGQTASGKDVSHIYTTANTYTVELTVMDNYGLTGTATKSLIIVETLSVFISPATDNIYTGKSVSFTSSVLGGTSPFFIRWFVNGIESGTGNGYIFVGTADGQFNIQARVIDALSRSAQSNTATVTVSTPPPPLDSGTLKIFAWNTTSQQYISITAQLITPTETITVNIPTSGYVDSSAPTGFYKVYATVLAQYSEKSGVLGADQELTLTLEFGEPQPPPISIPWKIILGTISAISGTAMILYPSTKYESRRKRR